MSQSQWIPEFCYEESDDGSATSHIPFVPVPDGEHMPHLIYVFENRETGEFEPGPEGEELPVIEMTLHQYADMAVLKEKLTLEQYDVVRTALGLEPLAAAVEKGKKITAAVREKVT